jgi:4'-phosphopantetheinyl transferase EntD
LPDSIASPIVDLSNVSEWAGTSVSINCRQVEDHTKRLFKDERLIIRKSAPLRANTFSTARVCAHELLSELGKEPLALGRNSDGSIEWPPGVIGSVSHTDEWAVAAMALKGQTAAKALGVDLERIRILESDVINLIASPAEQKELNGKGHKPSQAIALFSLKESIYKCLRPSFGNFIDFHDVQVSQIASDRPQLNICNAVLAQHCDDKDIELRLSITSDHVFSLAWWREE